MPELKTGDPAPTFALSDQHGSEVSLGQFAGRKLLVYFYPKASTPGCTTQSCAVRDAREDLAGLGVDVVGISPDKPAANLRFDEKHALGFPLLSDEGHEVADAFGAWGEKSMLGKKYQGVVRSAFLVGEDGHLLGTFYKVSPGDTVPKARAVLESL